MTTRLLRPGCRSWLFGIEWFGTLRAFKVTVLLGPIGLGVVRNPR